MRRILSIILSITLSFFLFSCKKETKEKENKLYFDYTGIAETTSIAFTKEESFDLKTVFKVGNKTSSYNEKKLGVTTYDDIYFYMYEWGSNDEPKENDDAKISSDGIITRKRLCTVVVYAALKEEPNISDDEKANGSMHVLTLFFGNDKTFGLWEAPNDYLDIWLKDGEKKASITLEFKEDFSYIINISEGYFSSSLMVKLNSKTITGKLYGWCSSGAVRHDDNDNSNNSYDFKMEMNDYGLSYDLEYTLFTGLNLKEESNTYYNVRFLPKS